MCEIAKVSRSGYYRYLKIVDDQSKDYNDYLLIKEVFDQGRGKYGWRTIQMKLEADRGIIMNHKKIERIKRKYNLITKVRRKNLHKEGIKRTKEHRTFANILNRNFRQDSPRKIFCTDITYLPFNNQIAYLSAVKDIASREIVAWNLSPSLKIDIVLNTIENMQSNKDISSLENIIIHSDQGVHYTSPEYILRIRKLNMTQSMSRKGNCVDNAPMESFFGHFKDEVDYKNCKTFQELYQLTAEYIEYYNNERYQWNLKKMTPAQYRNHLLNTG